MQNQKEVHRSNRLRPNRNGPIIRAIAGLFAVPAILMFTGLIGITWLTTEGGLQPIHAQTQEIVDANIDIASFPVVTVTFDCSVVQLVTDTFSLSEDDQPQIIDRTNLNIDGPPTQVAFFLDLFRDRDGKLPSAMDELLFKAGVENDLIDYLKEFGDTRNPTYIIAGRDSLGIFVPARDLVTPHSILAPNLFTYDVNSLINGLQDIRVLNPGSARLVDRPTTGFVDSLLQLLNNFDETYPKQHILVAFSDGTDEISPPQNRDQLIATAVARGIPIYTVFVATSTPGDTDFLRLLAEQTGGQLVALSNEDREQLNAGSVLREFLLNVYPKPPRCQVAYRTTHSSPRKVLLREASQKVIAVGIMPKIVVPPPTVSINSLSVTPLISKSINATVTVTVTGAFPDQRQRHIQTVTYTINGPTPLTQRAAVTEFVRFTRTAQITIPNFITGNYLIRVEMIDDLGLRGEDTKPFGLYYKPPVPPDPPPPPLWQRFRAWMSERATAIGDYAKTREFAILTLILWVVILFLLLGFLLRWLFRQPIMRRRERGAIANLETEYKATLIRIHSDPKAPPLLPMIPLGNRKINIPEDLYHPIWKHYQMSDAQRSFTEMYRATIELEGADQFVIDRGQLVGEEDDLTLERQNVERQEPISIQVAETAQSFKLVSKKVEDKFMDDAIRPQAKFGPLHHGDILQLGETHYKFMRLTERSKTDIATTVLSSS